MAKETQTIEITNFSGRLTRILNGDLNSGFAKFTNSFGYDPFSKPLNLTWFNQPTNIAASIITEAVLAAKIWSFDANARFVYGIGNFGTIYKINPTNSASSEIPLQDTPSVIGKLVSGSPTFKYGSDINFFNSKMFFTSDATIVRTDFDGSGETVVGSVTAGINHPQIQFAGALYVGNGNNLVKVDTTNTIVNGAVLSPALPLGTYIKDLDMTPDGNYMIITSSYLYPANIYDTSSANTGDRGNPYAVESDIFYWNGTDLSITAAKILPSYPASALNTSLDHQYFFNNDAFGAGLYDANKKLITMPQVLAPTPYGVTSNGTFLTWITPEVTGLVNSATQGASVYASLFYYGQLDAETPLGLWRVMRQATSNASNKVWRTPLNMMVNNFSFSTNFVLGWGKHYISVYEAGSSNSYPFYRFVLPPAANTNPILGVYETQTQLFSKRIGIAQVRIYTEPVIANNGFQLDLTDSQGSVVSGGTFTYVFGDPVDGNERINFNPSTDSLYAFGVRITNTGTTNMTIKKVEVDYTEEGR